MDILNRYTAKPTDSGIAGQVIFYDGTDFTDDFINGKGAYYSNGTNWVFMFSIDSPPKRYFATLSQAGTFNPGEDYVLQNTLGTVLLTRTTTGSYKFEATGLLNPGKTVVVFGNVFNGGTTNYVNFSVDYTAMDVDSFEFVAYNDAGVPSDDILLGTPIDVLVYP